MAVEEARARVGTDGVVLGDELDRLGYGGTLPCPGVVPHAYVELHVEQGPVLAAIGAPVGAVTGVQGISWQELTITGQAGHTGTSPMVGRHDALATAASLVTSVRGLAAEWGGRQVATVGRMEVHPNLVNAIPDRVTMTVDLRNTDAELLVQAEHVLAARCQALAARDGVTITARPLAHYPPQGFDPDIVRLVEATAARLGHQAALLPSGAGHAAQMLARVCPTAMVFAPSRGGISHHPDEHTDPAHVQACADVLAHVLVALATDAPRGAPVTRP
jgi:N-carbamoyl-L-amino-acid hydrolase